jgi:hypothetical protein
MSAVAVSRRAAALSLLIVAALLAAPTAQAQDRTPTPSADELWQEYPLQSDATATPAATESPAAAPTAAASPAPSTPSGSADTSEDSGGMSVAVLLFLIADAIALVTLAAALLHRRGDRARGAPPAARRDRHAAAALCPPPDPDRRWSAEIEWRSDGDQARFAVVARDRPTSDGTVLATSAPLDWPPAGPDAVRALSAAADRLAATYTDAGWNPMPPGDAWYAKRFAWLPSQQRGDRFQRDGAWPAETAVAWRCEIEWTAGYGRPRFQAVMYAPGDPQGRPIGASRAFGWMELDTPDPSATAHQAEVHGLVTALEAAGWRRVGQGQAWYAERFAWPEETPPPDRLEPLPAAAEPAP